MAAYISVPRDFSKVKSKVAFNLTARQLVCFGAAAVVGVPLFFVLRDTAGNSGATLGMMAVMLPMFFLYLVLLRRGYRGWLRVPQREQDVQTINVGTFQRNHHCLSRPVWKGCGRYQRTCRPWPLRWVLPAFAHSPHGSPPGDDAANGDRPGYADRP